jgi:hypothetical protein
LAVFHPAGATLGRLHPAPWAGFTSSTCRLPRPLAREREGARRYHIKLQPLGRGFGGWAKLQDGRLLNPLYSTRLLGYLGKQWWPNLGLFVHAHALRRHPQTTTRSLGGPTWRRPPPPAAAAEVHGAAKLDAAAGLLGLREAVPTAAAAAAAQAPPPADEPPRGDEGARGADRERAGGLDCSSYPLSDSNKHPPPRLQSSS